MIKRGELIEFEMNEQAHVGLVIDTAPIQNCISQVKAWKERGSGGGQLIHSTTIPEGTYLVTYAHGLITLIQPTPTDTDTFKKGGKTIKRKKQ